MEYAILFRGLGAVQGIANLRAFRLRCQVQPKRFFVPAALHAELHFTCYSGDRFPVGGARGRFAEKPFRAPQRFLPGCREPVGDVPFLFWVGRRVFVDDREPVAGEQPEVVAFALEGKISMKRGVRIAAILAREEDDQILTRLYRGCRNLPPYRFFSVVRQVGAGKIDRLFAVIMELEPVTVVAVFVLQARVIDGGELVYHDRRIGIRPQAQGQGEEQGMRDRGFQSGHDDECLARGGFLLPDGLQLVRAGFSVAVRIEAFPAGLLLI